MKQFLARLPFVIIYTLTIPLTVILVKKFSPRIGWWAGVLLAVLVKFGCI